MVRTPVHHTLGTMSITPSKALLEALSPIKFRGAAPAQVHATAGVKTAVPTPAAPAATTPAPTNEQHSVRPMRRGSILDISV